jgi:hypothetical protein
MTDIVRPAICTDEHLNYLDDLRDSGITNMWNASSFLEEYFDLSSNDAKNIFLYWIGTFTDRH